MTTPAQPARNRLPPALYVLALDPGGRQDYAAVVGLRVDSKIQRVAEVDYVDQIKGLGYIEQTEALFDLFKRFEELYRGRVVVAIDANGVGAACFETLAERGVPLMGIRPTTGLSVGRPEKFLGREHPAWLMTVSGNKLITTLRSLYQKHELLLPDSVPNIGELKRQLSVTVPSFTKQKKSQRFDAPSGDHDDLASALMLSCYVADFLLDGKYKAIAGTMLLYLQTRRGGQSGPAFSDAAWT